MLVHLVVGAVASFMFPVLSLAGGSDSSEPWRTILWCGLWRFLTGLSFAFETATTIKFATSFVSDPARITSIVSTLHYSWPISTVLNVCAGYVIQYESWRWVFIWTGVLLLLSALLLKLVLLRFPLSSVSNA